MIFRPDNNSKTFSLEAMKVKVAERLRKAIGNAISFNRYKELATRYSFLENKFIETGEKEADDIREQDLIRNEIFLSVAMAEHLIEFQELLNQVRILLPGLTQEWQEDNLAHENAHASVSEQEGFQWLGYGLLFVNMGNRQLAITPQVFSLPDMSWTPEELVRKKIILTEAPEAYGKKLSKQDVKSIQESQNKLGNLKTSGNTK